MYVGLDVHKNSISVSVAEAGRDREVGFFGSIGNSRRALNRLLERLSRDDRVLRFCYEAGPCGYGIYRHLTGLGQDCVVAAPSLIPRWPGERVKTDRRDSGPQSWARPGRRAHRHLVAGCRARGDARPGAGQGGGGARCAQGAPAPVGVSVVPASAVCAQVVEPGAPGAGWPSFASSIRRSRSCRRNISTPSTPPRLGATG